jgi:hypothetical protein
MSAGPLTIELLGKQSQPLHKPRTIDRRVAREQLVEELRKLRKGYAVSVFPGASSWYSNMIQYETNLAQGPLFQRIFVIRSSPERNLVVIWRES